MSSASVPSPTGPAANRRVLALGKSLAPLANGPLLGATFELGELADLASAAERTDLVIIESDAWQPAELSAAVATLGRLHACPPVLMVGDKLPSSLVRDLLRLPLADILETPFTGEAFISAVEVLLNHAAIAAMAAASSPVESRCWAVSGAVGGAGSTTVAIEIAYALSKSVEYPRGVCLVDLNLADGAAAAYLGARPTTRLADYSQAAERLDAAMLRAVVTPVGARLDLLAGVRDAAAFDQVGRDVVIRLLEVACDCYDVVILDMPRHRHAWTLEVLSGCDEVIVVSELTVPALLAARDYCEEIEAVIARRPRIVLNRVAGGGLFGSAPSLAEAEMALQRKAEAGLSSDWEAAAASVNLGGPIAQHRPKSKIVRDIRLLVQRLAANSARRENSEAA